MKKILISLCSLLFITTWVKAQNQYPTEKNSHPVIDGGHIIMIRHNTTEGWANGLLYNENPSSSIAAGIGAFGVGKNFHYLYFGINSSPWDDLSKGMFLRENGRLGIATNNPIAKFDVSGGKLGQEKGSELPIAAFTSSNANQNKLIIKQMRWANDNQWISASTRLQLITDITPQGYIEFNSIPPSGVGTAENHRYDKVGITMGHGNQEYFRMNYGNGFIGLGTNDPDERLTVKGKIHAEEVKIDLQVPADYVFQKYYTGRSSLKEEYKLPSLEEVEKFTKENHHLPEIPSAKEIQENGLQLGEMTNLLLQKIEEMTIYIIEQQKQIEQLKQIIDSQNK